MQIIILILTPCSELQHLCRTVFAAQTGSSWLWHVCKIEQPLVQALLPVMPRVA